MTGANAADVSRGRHRPRGAPLRHAGPGRPKRQFRRPTDGFESALAARRPGRRTGTTNPGGLSGLDGLADRTPPCGKRNP